MFHTPRIVQNKALRHGLSVGALIQKLPIWHASRMELMCIVLSDADMRSFQTHEEVRTSEAAGGGCRVLDAVNV